VSAAFMKGDRVKVRVLGNRIGIVDGPPRSQRGMTLYPVSFDPSQSSPYYPADALEVHVPPARGLRHALDLGIYLQSGDSVSVVAGGMGTPPPDVRTPGAGPWPNARPPAGT
jgi:hypothetical protein